MKKSYAFALLSGLLMLGSCANDAPEIPQFDPIDAEGNIGYIRLKMANSETRAADEQAGTTDERSIKHIDFLFVGVDNTPFRVHVDANEIENNQAVVKLPKLPKTVAVVVNGNSSQLDNITNLNTLDYAVSQYTNSGTEDKDFYMSSTKYWAGQNHAITYRTNISTDQVYKSAEEAKGGKAVSVTVERYVAKVNVSSAVELDEKGALNPLTGDNAGEVKAGENSAVVTFTPEYVFLTGTNDKGYRLKNIPTWEDMQNLGMTGWVNDENNKRSFWVGNTAGNVKFESINTLANHTAKFSKSITSNASFYPFENKENEYSKKTSVVVAGKYTVHDADGKDLANTDGTFYLVAFENQFTVYKTEAEAIAAMGGTANDKLVAEGADGNDITANYANDAWTGWTGWMKIKGSNNVIRCLKYSGGYGYYSKEIVRYVDDEDNSHEAIVRNHVYTINIKGISGMGVGIPDPDQPIINIPNPDPTRQNYFLNMSVKVAAWKVVEDQNVEWK